MYVLAAEGGNYGSATIYQMLKLPPTEKALHMKDGFVSKYCGFIRKCIQSSFCECILGISTGIQFHKGKGMHFRYDEEKY